MCTEEEDFVKDLDRLSDGRIAVGFDPRRGVVRSIVDPADPRPLNFVGTPESISDPGFLADPAWLGDVVLRTWSGSGWRKERTSRSGDCRRVQVDRDRRLVEIRCAGPSSDPEGLQTVDVHERFALEDGGLRWEIALTNRTEEALEIGEVAFPLTMNIDYASLFRGPGRRETDIEQQRAWHEERVMMHLCICGHSSYGIFCRPAGDGRFLLFHTLGDTALEAAYKLDGTEGSQWDVVWEGQHLVAAHSWARKQENVWNAPREPQRSWINGHSYVLLAPGESKSFAFRFVLLERHRQVHDELVRHGRIAARVRPGMVVPVETPVQLHVQSQDEVRLIPEASDVEIRPVEPRAPAGVRAFEISFRTRGQKKIRVEHGDGRWTHLLFYALPPFGELLAARARFIVDRQLYENPYDPYGRDGAFLPYDSMLDAPFLESDEAWQVGGSDEYALPIAMFLAEKNVHSPNRREVEALERFIDTFLFGRLQNRDTYEVRRGMVWFADHPSRAPMQWDRATAELTTRTYNYPLVANIYHAMYRIGRAHGLVQRYASEQYLDMCWHTSMKWLEIGRHWTYGAPAGGNLVNILDDLERDAPEKYEQLAAKAVVVADTMERTPYPFGSELYVDQTGHDQVHGMMVRFGRAEKARQTLRVTKALRAGGQPVWFWYGNEKRGSVSCWYAQTQNSRVLLSGFEETGDREMLAWGYGGLTSFLTTIRDHGAARGWFLWWPDRMGFDLRSLDTDLGLYGYLLAAKAYVDDDDEFGLVGYGCEVERLAPGRYRIAPSDGLRKRLRIVPLGLDLLAAKGEIAQVTLSPAAGRLQVVIEDPTGLVADAEFELIGAQATQCSLEKGDATLDVTGAGRLRVVAPLGGRIEMEFRMPLAQSASLE